MNYLAYPETDQDSLGGIAAVIAAIGSAIGSVLAGKGKSKPQAPTQPPAGYLPTIDYKPPVDYTKIAIIGGGFALVAILIIAMQRR